MAVSPDTLAFHKEQARIARALYEASFSPSEAAQDWLEAKSEARKLVLSMLRATNFLTDVSAALCKSAEHIAVLRRIMAPPMSQDQFKLLCPLYEKGRENSGRPLDASTAIAIADVLLLWRDRRLTNWLSAGRRPSRRELIVLLETVSPLIASQSVGTKRRNAMAAKQEGDVISLLEHMRWKRKPSTLISSLSAISAKQYMHKTRFSTKTSPQEVDIACGLGGTVVLAMECKVTNDETNSVKRINDVLKKARAWETHWGSFVKTAALLQGVVGYKDVLRLLDEGVNVFWSHRLDDFQAWLDANVA